MGCILWGKARAIVGAGVRRVAVHSNRARQGKETGGDESTAIGAGREKP